MWLFSLHRENNDLWPCPFSDQIYFAKNQRWELNTGPLRPLMTTTLRKRGPWSLVAWFHAAQSHRAPILLSVIVHEDQLSNASSSKNILHNPVPINCISYYVWSSALISSIIVLISAAQRCNILLNNLIHLRFNFSASRPPVSPAGSFWFHRLQPVCSSAAIQLILCLRSGELDWSTRSRLWRVYADRWKEIVTSRSSKDNTR